MHFETWKHVFSEFACKCILLKRSQMLSFRYIVTKLERICFETKLIVLVISFFIIVDNKSTKNRNHITFVLMIQSRLCIFLVHWVLLASAKSISKKSLYYEFCKLYIWSFNVFFSKNKISNLISKSFVIYTMVFIFVIINIKP